MRGEITKYCFHRTMSIYDTTDKIEVKFVHVIKLYFGDHLKRANTQKSCYIGKSFKKHAGMSGFFFVTAHLRVFIQEQL